jgi:hypothetical protein
MMVPGCVRSVIEMWSINGFFLNTFNFAENRATADLDTFIDSVFILGPSSY